jgi:hypothetical protein
MSLPDPSCIGPASRHRRDADDAATQLNRLQRLDEGLTRYVRRLITSRVGRGRPLAAPDPAKRDAMVTVFRNAAGMPTTTQAAWY